jgi:hypothetical protein
MNALRDASELTQVFSLQSLSCPLCYKLFSKGKPRSSTCKNAPKAHFLHYLTLSVESTFKRHGYYCRSRPSDQRVRRGRSCTVCARAKTRCSSEYPQCSRCKARKFECQYIDQTRALSPTATSISTLVSSISTAHQANPSAREVLSVLRDGLPEIQASMPNKLDVLNTEFTVADKENDMGEDELYSGIMFEYNIMEIEPILHFDSIITPNLSSSFVPTAVTEFNAKRNATGNFDTRMTIKSRFQNSASMLLRILYSYPKMMLRTETFPPFIHPVASAEGDKHISNAKQESLNNCRGLAQIYAIGSQDSRKLLWKMIREECERIWADVRPQSQCVCCSFTNKL